MATILGIDEAGRGPVVGPLVLCGVRVTPHQQQQLLALEPQDSKAYGSGASARQRRARLAQQIRQIATVQIEVADAEEIDRWTGDRGLNQLEQQLARHIIDRDPPPGRVIADGHRLFAPLCPDYPQLLAVDRADQEHPVVAAASVVAKAERDRLFEELLSPYQAELGPIAGGGYPNAATAAFLRAYVQRHRQLPPGVRRSWSWQVLRELMAACEVSEPA